MFGRSSAGAEQVTLPTGNSGGWGLLLLPLGSTADEETHADKDTAGRAGTHRKERHRENTVEAQERKPFSRIKEGQEEEEGT